MELKQKLRTFIKHQRGNSVSARQLREFNQEYEVQYRDLNDKEVVERFMDFFRHYIEEELANEGYLNNPNTPGEYLVSFAQVGVRELLLFAGLFPLRFQALLTPAIERYLIKLFKLKAFNGFTIVIKPQRDSSMTTISLSWTVFSGGAFREGVNGAVAPVPSHIMTPLQSGLAAPATPQLTAEGTRKGRGTRFTVTQKQPVAVPPPLTQPMVMMMPAPVPAPVPVDHSVAVKREVKRNMRKIKREIQKSLSAVQQETISETVSAVLGSKEIHGTTSSIDDDLVDLVDLLGPLGDTTTGPTTDVGNVPNGTSSTIGRFTVEKPTKII